MKLTRGLILCLFLNSTSDEQIQALKLNVQEQQRGQQSFISDQIREIASRAPEMGNLQRKIEQMETLKPRIYDDMRKIDEVLRPLPQPAEIPDPPPIRVKVAQPPPPPTPIVIQAGATAVASAGGATATSGAPVRVINGKSGSDSVTDLAKKALDNIKIAGGNPKLEQQIGSVAKKALKTLEGDHSAGPYAKVGGAGNQASLQTSSRIKQKHSDDISTLARKAIESLNGGDDDKSSSRPKFARKDDDIGSLAKTAMKSLDGGSSDNDNYQGDDIAQLARKAISNLEGGDSSEGDRRENDIGSLAKDALKNMDGGSRGSSDQISDMARGALNHMQGQPMNAPAPNQAPSTADLAAQAAAKLASSNQVVMQPAAQPQQQPQPQQLESDPKSKKHHKKKAGSNDKEEKSDKEEKAEAGGESEEGPSDGKQALKQAKKDLKRLHKLNKQKYGFISTKDSPMLNVGNTNSNLDDIAGKALQKTVNSEPVPLLAKQSLRKEVENESFARDQQEAASYGVNIKKPLYEEDEQENRQKVDRAISQANDKIRKMDIKDAVEAKLEEKATTFEELTLNKLKSYTDRIGQETDSEVAKIESQEALAREHQEALKSAVKGSNQEKEFNKAKTKILKSQKEEEKDKETNDKLSDKEFKKEHEHKEKEAEKKLEKMEKKDMKKKLDDQVKKEEKEKQEKIEEGDADRQVKEKQEDDAGKSDIEKEIENAVAKAETEGKIPTEQQLQKAEDAVKNAALDTEKLSQQNTEVNADQVEQEIMVIKI